MSNENKSDLKQTKYEKNPTNKKLYSPTIRLTITLREPDEDSCSVFNYVSLLAEEKRNRKREKEKDSENGPVEESEELDDEVRKLAQHFEEKYGAPAAKKKKKKKAPTFYNYSELAAGYDENDSFIDNSEAFDEALPDEMETFHGGYYVNCGQLEFKKIALLDDTSDADEVKMVKKKNCILKSDDSNSNDESSRSELNSELEEDDAESALKKLPEETCAKDIEVNKNSQETNKVADKIMIDKAGLNMIEAISMNGDVAQKKRKKYKKRRLSEDAAEDQMSRPKKKALTVKVLLEEKRIVENGENNGSGGKNNENFHNSINDVIESVVNAARNHSEDSRDSIFSSSDAKSIDSRTSYDTEKENHVEELEVAELVNSDTGISQVLKDHVKLPDNLPSDVLDLVTQIKNSAQNSELGARTFFNSQVNSKLLSLETKVRSLTTNTRHTLYGYLAYFLPCSKDTLMKRAKKLLVEEEETRMAELFKKLRHSIDKTMPALMDNYIAATKQFAEEKNAGGFNKNGEFDEKKACFRPPSRKFVWTDETRSYVRDLVSYHLKYLHMLKPNKELSDVCVKKFLETKIKPLWPAGWMSTTALLREIQIKSISSKVKKASAANNVTNAKKAHIPVPTSSNTSTTIVNASTNYNLLTNSLALQSLSMQYSSQSDPVYPVTCSTSIPYCPDLSIISAASLSSQASSLPVPMSILSRIAASNNQYPSNVSYSKSNSPPKKQSSSYVPVRSTTPASVTTQPSVSFVDTKKITEAPSSKYNDFKIDSLINSSKPKKEHHMLNHISQYNKHYSHKGEKRKSGSNEKKEVYTLSRSPVNPNVSSSNSYNSCNNNNNGKHSHSSSTSSAVNCHNLEQTKTKSSDQVLDLSPNKVVKNEVKVSEVKTSSVGQSHSSTSFGSASITATDHSYWSSSKKEVDKKEDSRQDLIITPVVSENVNSNQNVNPKPTHISRKQRILQESKLVTYEVPKTWPEKNSLTVYENLSCGSALRNSPDSINSRIESPAVSIKCVKNSDEKVVVYDEKKSLAEEKKMIEDATTATDILSKIINDTLQDNSTPLPPQFVSPGLENIKKKPEVEIQESTRNGETEMTLHLCKKESPRHLQEKSYSTLNSDRKTPNTDRAEMEAAEVINDLLVLNQLGGHSIPRRMDYQDSSRFTDKNTNEFNGNESNVNQSSLLSSDVGSSLPRLPNFSGFQDEFFKHIFKDHGN